MTSYVYARRTLALLGFSLWTLIAQAADYPSQPIKVIVPFPAGGSTDLVTRALAVELAVVLKQTVVVDNKAGAGSLLGSEFVAKAPADGYTLLMAGLTNVFLPYVHKNLRFHPVDDFAHIGLVADLPNVIAVNATTPYKRLDDLIKAEKAKPKSINFASAGVATPSHLVCEMVNFQTGTQLDHVPYKGNAQALTELLGGQITMHISSMLSATPYISSGRLKPIGVTSAHRSRAAPQVPTFAESGITGYDASSLWGFLAPASTPALIISRLNTEIKKILQMPDVNDSLANQGADISGADPVQYALMMKIEQDKWRKLVEVAHIKAE